MSELLTYRLSDFLLFSPQTYYRLFELYNKDIWPIQILTLAFGAAITVLVVCKPVWHGRAVTAILSAVWLWVAWAYHLQRYATINWAAHFFAAGFAVEAGLLIWTGIIRGRLVYTSASLALNRAGLGVFIFALVVQPFGGLLLGRSWSQVELFGIAPDPTVVATLGILLRAADRTFWELFIIPVIWCTISGTTLWTMGSPDAFLTPLVMLVVMVLAVHKTWHSSKTS